MPSSLSANSWRVKSPSPSQSSSQRTSLKDNLSKPWLSPTRKSVRPSPKPWASAARTTNKSMNWWEWSDSTLPTSSNVNFYLISVENEEDYKMMTLGVAHGLSRYKLKFSAEKVDIMIIQAVSLLDELDKEINNYIMRLKEWYGWHFP